MTTHRTILLRAATAAVAGAAIFAIQPAAAQMFKPNAELQKIIDAAKKEGQIDIFAAESPSGGAEGARRVQAGIKKMFGVDIPVKWTPGPPYAQIASKLMTELQAKQPSSTDVYVGTAVQVVPVMKKGLFRTINWHKLYPERIKQEFSENNVALRHYTSLPGVVYNKKVEAMVQKTEVLADFLKPEWKGKFVTTPYLAGFDILLAKGSWGVDKTKDFIGKLSKQVGGLLGCGAPSRLASGEFNALVVDCSGGGPNRAKYKNVLGLHVLRDLAQRRYGYLAVPVHAKHPNAGILYALYWASPEGQKLEFELTGYDMSDYPDSQRAKEINALVKKGYKFTDVTLDWWAGQQGIPKAHRSMIKLLRRR